VRAEQIPCRSWRTGLDVGALAGTRTADGPACSFQGRFRPVLAAGGTLQLRFIRPAGNQGGNRESSCHRLPCSGHRRCRCRRGRVRHPVGPGPASQRTPDPAPYAYDPAARRRNWWSPSTTRLRPRSPATQAVTRPCAMCSGPRSPATQDLVPPCTMCSRHRSPATEAVTPPSAPQSPGTAGAAAFPLPAAVADLPLARRAPAAPNGWDRQSRP
jgi:hypothetical protein